MTAVGRTPPETMAVSLSIGGNIRAASMRGETDSSRSGIVVGVPEEYTTVTIPKSLRERFETFRRHPRETVADILTYIMDRAEGKA